MSEDRAWHCHDCDAEPDCHPFVLERATPVGRVRITLCAECYWRSPESQDEHGAEVEPEDDHE